MSMSYIDSNCAGFGRAPRTDCRLYEKQRIQVWILSHFSNSKMYINFPVPVKVRRALILIYIPCLSCLSQTWRQEPEQSRKERIVKQNSVASLTKQYSLTAQVQETLDSTLPKSRIVQSLRLKEQDHTDLLKDPNYWCFIQLYPFRPSMCSVLRDNCTHNFPQRDS